MINIAEGVYYFIIRLFLLLMGGLREAAPLLFKIVSGIIERIF